MKTRATGRRKQLCETALRACCAQRNPIQQDLHARRAEQQSRFAALIQRRAQFFPGGLKLRSSAHVAKFVQPRELQQDVQTAHELPRRRSRISAHWFPLADRRFENRSTALSYYSRMAESL